MLSLRSVRSPSQTSPDGEHHLEAEHQVARVAVGEHAGAAGIGREVAADLAGAFRGERQREQPVGGVGRGLRVGEDDAGLDGHRVAGRIDRADAVEPRQRDDDLVAALGRGSGRRRGRCCRPAARSASASRWRASGSPRLRRREPGRSTSGVAPVEAVARLDQIGRDRLRRRGARWARRRWRRSGRGGARRRRIHGAGY